MIIATAKLKSVSPYSQSRYHNTPKLDKENPVDYENRTWRNRLHTDNDGKVIIPPMTFKNTLANAAKFLSKQIPGKGKSTYTKHFEAGILVVEPLNLGIHKKDVEFEWLFVPSDGKRGSGTRVEKCFPLIREWEGEVQFLVLDDTITEDVFKETLIEAGRLIGIGRFRPRNNGFYGRFSVESINWEKKV
ncbi:MAG: hypothetical protein ACXABY_09830 [Candidatus Thorarchaeota archaeon]|jgi:hypothetical protein